LFYFVVYLNIKQAQTMAQSLITLSAKNLRTGLKIYGIPYMSCKQTGQSISIVVKPQYIDQLIFWFKDVDIVNVLGKEVTRKDINGSANNYAEFCSLFGCVPKWEE